MLSGVGDVDLGPHEAMRHVVGISAEGGGVPVRDYGGGASWGRRGLGRRSWPSPSTGRYSRRSPLSPAWAGRVPAVRPSERIRNVRFARRRTSPRRQPWATGGGSHLRVPECVLPLTIGPPTAAGCVRRGVSERSGHPPQLQLLHYLVYCRLLRVSHLGVVGPGGGCNGSGSGRADEAVGGGGRDLVLEEARGEVSTLTRTETARG